MPLSAKHKQFIDKYLELFNATEAYGQVYSPKTRAAAASNGYKLLRKTEIAEAISERLQESAMSADEVLNRLAEHGRGSMGDFTLLDGDGQPHLDLQSASLMGKLHLIRKLKTKTRTYTNRAKSEHDEDETVVEVDTEIELYNAQTALELIGKTHKLFTDREAPDGSEDNPIHIKHIREIRPSDDAAE